MLYQNQTFLASCCLSLSHEFCRFSTHSLIPFLRGDTEPGISADVNKISIRHRCLLWDKYLRTLRSYFFHHGFIECQTPCLVDSPGTEPSIDVFQFETKEAGVQKKKYLRTSPEISLKKLLCQGSGNIFEIAPVFRGNEWTAHHRPEFRMMEWYRVDESLDAIMKDLQNLVSHLILDPEFKTAAADCGLKLNVPSSFTVVSIPQLFREKLKFPMTPMTTLEEYKNACIQWNLDTQSMETIDDFFFQLWVEKIETTFDPQVAYFVKDYPPFQRAYSKLNASGWAERFEMFWGGLEIGNAFFEETNPTIQRQLFTEDNRKKQKMGKSAVNIDESFLQLMSNMPECSGIAIGLERLLMAIAGIKNIEMV